MKLLVDAMISPRLTGQLSTAFPGTLHVRDVGLGTASDTNVWEYARTHGFAIVTKDSDFSARCVLYGHPPKVIWVRLGNCSTAQIQTVLSAASERILAFDGDEEAALLVLP